MKLYSQIDRKNNYPSNNQPPPPQSPLKPNKSKNNSKFNLDPNRYFHQNHDLIQALYNQPSHIFIEPQQQPSKQSLQPVRQSKSPRKKIFDQIPRPQIVNEPPPNPNKIIQSVLVNQQTVYKQPVVFQPPKTNQPAAVAISQYPQQPQVKITYVDNPPPKITYTPIQRNSRANLTNDYEQEKINKIITSPILQQMPKNNTDDSSSRMIQQNLINALTDQRNQSRSIYMQNSGKLKTGQDINPQIQEISRQIPTILTKLDRNQQQITQIRHLLQNKLKQYQKNQIKFRQQVNQKHKSLEKQLSSRYLRTCTHNPHQQTKTKLQEQQRKRLEQLVQQNRYLCSKVLQQRNRKNNYHSKIIRETVHRGDRYEPINPRQINNQQYINNRLRQLQRQRQLNQINNKSYQDYLSTLDISAIPKQKHIQQQTSKNNEFTQNNHLQQQLQQTRKVPISRIY